jgi:hypothetical protein
MRKLFVPALVAGLAFVMACGGSKSPAGHNDAAIDAPNVVTPDASCFTNPTTSNEIINACVGSNVTIIYDTKPTPPLTLADGGLPPLPN